MSTENRNETAVSSEQPKTTQQELSDNELQQISGGLIISGIGGESTDDKHKDWIAR